MCGWYGYNLLPARKTWNWIGQDGKCNDQKGLIRHHNLCIALVASRIQSSNRVHAISSDQTAYLLTAEPTGALPSPLDYLQWARFSLLLHYMCINGASLMFEAVHL